ncbi:hypothetical protein ACUHMQ_15715 [Chitinimonas sp. PSY-7]|uniref:hypothetical protein n=1 Tax=Chitinimonas sp. PSY-7 TaxID=3459088 RepID=UPI00403FD6B0
MEELGLMDVDRVAGGMFSDTGFGAADGFPGMDLVLSTSEWSIAAFPGAAIALPPDMVTHTRYDVSSEQFR